MAGRSESKAGGKPGAGGAVEGRAAGAAPDAGEWEAILRAAEEACWEAGQVAREAAAAGPDFEVKPDGSPVTEHDRAVEALLRKRLEAARPAFGWVGEETGVARADARLKWVVDPIDGTKSFIAGLPVYGIFVGVALDGAAAAGAMALPEQHEIFTAAPGLGCRESRRPVRSADLVAASRPLGQAPALVGNPAALEERAPGAARRLSERFAFLCPGGGCTGLGLLLRGRVAASVESGLSSYDFMAAAALVAGAGGVATDWGGRPLTLDSGLDAPGAASNPLAGTFVAGAGEAAHRAALEALGAA